MRVQAIYKNFRMSPQKMREMVRQIQGLPALQAQAVLAVVPRKSARVVAKTLKSANWRVLTTNAPIVYNYSYVNFLQEYPAWVKAGALDFVSPQIYRSDVDGFIRELDRQLGALGGDAARFVPGLDVTNGGTEVLIRQIEACRERKLAGVVIWYSGGLVQKGSFGRLKETVFAAPAALPWK